jgi:hypothetical protein
MDRGEHDLSATHWAALAAAWEAARTAVRQLSRYGATVCWCCHVVGGTRSTTSCRRAARCNTSKCNDEVTSWLRRTRLDERAFLLRHYEISTVLALQFGADAATAVTNGSMRR